MLHKPVIAFFIYYIKVFFKVTVGLKILLFFSFFLFSDQNRVIICGFNNSQLTMAECQVSALSLAIDSFQLLIATKEQDIHQWKKNVCQQVIWKDVTEKCKITQIQAGEMNCVGIRGRELTLLLLKAT